MGYLAEARDLTNQYKSYGRILSDYRPINGVLYSPGMNCQLVAQDLQVYPDAGTIQPTPPAQRSKVVGVVSEAWPGFAAQAPGLAYTFTSPTDASTPPRLRGTQGILCVVQGFHPTVLVDGSGGSSPITNGTILVPSAVSPGYAQGSATLPIVGMGQVGVATLPSGVTYPATALTQATLSFTGSPSFSLGNDATLLITLPNGALLTVPVIGANASSAIAAAINGRPEFARYFTATVPSLGQIFITVNGSGTFMQTYRLPTGQTAEYQVSLSGIVGNQVIAQMVRPNGTVTPAAPTPLAGGAGYRGVVPAFITGALC